MCWENIFTNAMAEKKEVLEEQIETAMSPAEGEDAPSTVSVTETETTVTPPPSRSREWMQKKYPERTWESDEAYDDDLTTELETAESRLAEYRDNETEIGRVLEMNPEFALAVQAMADGVPARVAIRRYLGDVLAEPEEGDDDLEAYKDAAEKFLAEKTSADEEIAKRNANLEKSDVMFKDFVEANFPTEEEQVEFVEYVRSTLRNIGMGDFSPEFFNMMLKAYKHDEDVEDAKEAGAIEARNEKITAKRVKAAEETDGMPMGGGTSPIVEEAVEDDSAIGSILRDYEKRRR